MSDELEKIRRTENHVFRIHTWVSSTVTPNFFTTLISLRSTFVAVFGSMTCITASTTIGERMGEYWDTIYENYKRVG